MLIEEKKLILGDPDILKHEIIRNTIFDDSIYSDLLNYSPLKIKRGECCEYCDYMMFDHDVYIHTNEVFEPILDTFKQSLGITSIVDFTVSKYGSPYLYGDELIIVGLNGGIEGQSLFIISCTVSTLNNDGIHIDKPKIICEIQAMSTDDGDIETAIGIQNTRDCVFIATNYRFIVLTKKYTEQYDYMLTYEMEMDIYPSGMIRPNGMVVSNDDTIILYYSNDIIPIFYKFLGMDKENKWYSFVDQQDYQIIDAIIYDDKLIIYGDDSNIHYVDNIHELNPAINDFLIHNGHTWVGNTTCINGNIFMQSISIDANSSTHVNFMYSINGINFDKYAEIIIGDILPSDFHPTAYVGRGSIILYGCGNLDNDKILSTKVDMSNFEYIDTYSKIPILSISKIDNSAKWCVRTDLDVPINLSNVDASIIVTDLKNDNSSVDAGFITKYHTLIRYNGYCIEHDLDGKSKLILIFDFGSINPTNIEFYIDLSFCTNV